MTETIQQLKEDIAILQEKLQKLEELQRTKSPAEEAFKRVYYRYPDKLDVEHGVWDIFEKGYNTSKEDCKVEEGEMIKRNLKTSLQELSNGDVRPMDDVIDRLLEKYKSQKLWNMVRNELGYSIDCTEEIVDAVEEWLVKEQSAAGSQNVDTELLVDGFNDCVRKMKEMLR
jgi:hypothetical protein